MTVEDLTGLGKALDTDVARRTYDEGLSPAIRNAGAFAGDLIQAFRLFTLPIQLAATAQFRLEKWLAEVRDRVPVDRQQDAPAEIAGPVLRCLMFVDDESHLQRMFMQILQLSIDKQHVHDIHPAFIKTVEQISTDEAVVLSLIQSEKMQKDFAASAVMIGFMTLENHLKKTERLAISLERLASMAICESGDWDLEDTWMKTTKTRGPSLRINLTKFGIRFLNCVVPKSS